MSKWFTSNLGDAMLAGEALEHIKALFAAAHTRSNGSNKIAVFIRRVIEGRLNCEERVYFSPETAHVADAVGAITFHSLAMTALMPAILPAWSPSNKHDGIDQ